MLGYLLSDDLMFTSRVNVTARAAGLVVQNAKSAQQLQSLVAAAKPQCLIIDLNNPGLSIGDLMQALPEPRPFVVGFGSHVNTAALKAGTDAGCDLVLPRSKFVEELGNSLPKWFAARGNPSEPEA